MSDASKRIDEWANERDGRDRPGILWAAYRDKSALEGMTGSIDDAEPKRYY